LPSCEASCAARIRPSSVGQPGSGPSGAATPCAWR